MYYASKNTFFMIGSLGIVSALSAWAALGRTCLTAAVTAGAGLRALGGVTSVAPQPVEAINSGIYFGSAQSDSRMRPVLEQHVGRGAQRTPPPPPPIRAASPSPPAPAT